MKIIRQIRSTRRLLVAFVVVSVLFNVAFLVLYRGHSRLTLTLTNASHALRIFGVEDNVGEPYKCNDTTRGDMESGKANCSSQTTQIETVEEKPKVKTKVRKSRQKSSPDNPLFPINIYNRIDKNWTFNASAADEFRSWLQKNCNTSELFVVNKENVRINDTIRYEASPSIRLNITSEIYERLPKEMPYMKKRFKKCSIVGNSGLISGSGCGTSIDSADFVIRSNFAKVENFTHDAGNKTNLMSCNPTLIRDRYQSLNTTEWKERFVSDVLSEYGTTTLWIPAFSSSYCKEIAFLVQDTLRKAHIDAVFPHPEHFILTRSFWKNNGINAVRISTGLLLITDAISFCEEVHIYGFWPFLKDAKGRPLNYHYFDPEAIMYPAWKAKRKWHQMPSEFEFLVSLHNKGALRLHVNNCR